MKCPKCGFNSFEYLDSCKKCGNDLAAFKLSVGLQPVVMPPGVFTGQEAGREEPEPEFSITQETAAPPVSTGDEFEFDATAVTPVETPAAAQEESAFGEISFDDTGSDTAPSWGGSEQSDGFSGQEFAGFDAEPAAPAAEAAKDDAFADIFGKEEAKPAEKKPADDFFNSPELADLFKDESAEKK